MKIRKAEIHEYEAVLEFYHQMMELMPMLPASGKWTRDVYPTDGDIRGHLEAGNMYVGIEDGQIVAGMVLNHHQDEAYAKVKWRVDAAQEEVVALHLLGVLPTMNRRGYGKQMVNWAIEHSREQGNKAMRLDVLVGNTLAEALYPKCGFEYIENVQLYYEDTGWADFEMFERKL